MSNPLKWLLALLMLAPAMGVAAMPASPAVRVEVIASGLDHPWGLAFLPDGGVLVTERRGRLRLIEGGRMRVVTGVPPVFANDQAGLFDVVAHPDFARNRLVYLVHAAGTQRANGTAVTRARLDGTALSQVRTLWSATPAKRGPAHFGGRLVFLPDGTMLFQTGDGFEFREQAQRLDSPLGKTIRLTDDGGIPGDNPFLAVAGAQPGVYSRGHRNPQGLAFDPARGLLFSHEHGPRGGDEVNIIVARANYGWPVATRGRDYSGATISPYRSYPGMIEPLLDWTPSIAPSGLAVYRGAMFPEWQGDLLVGALLTKDLRRIHLSPDGRRVLGQEALARQVGQRVRDVRVAPDGSVWLLTDEDRGQVLRLTRG